MLTAAGYAASIRDASCIPEVAQVEMPEQSALLLLPVSQQRQLEAANPQRRRQISPFTWTRWIEDPLRYILQVLRLGHLQGKRRGNNSNGLVAKVTAKIYIVASSRVHSLT